MLPKDFLGFLQNNSIRDNIEYVIKRCVEIKGDIVNRDEFDKNDMGIYQTADFGPHYLIRAKAEKAPTIDEYMDMLDKTDFKPRMARKDRGNNQVPHREPRGSVLGLYSRSCTAMP